MEECEDCKLEKEDVRRRLCPYAQVILNEHINCDICDDCFNKREANIELALK